MIQISTDVKVEFFDVDAMKVVWHGNYVRFVEAGRSALYDHLKFGYTEMETTGYSWPVVDLHIRYLKPARLGDLLQVTAKLVEWENRIRMEFVIRNVATGEKITKAESIQVAVNSKTGELQFECPEVFLSKVKKALT